MKHSLKILYLVPDLLAKPGGIARYCQMVCLALQDTKITLQVDVLLDSKLNKPRARVAFPNISYFPCEGSYSEYILNAFRLTMTYRPDIILVGHPHFSTLGWWLSSLTGGRLITFVYGIDIWEQLSRFRRFGVHKSQQILAISKFTAHKAIGANRLDPNRINILHNCLDPQFSNNYQKRHHDNDLSMLTVARLVEGYKGHVNVIKSMPFLLKQFPSLKYDIVGDGNGRAMLESLVSDLNIGHAVNFHGSVTDEELRQHYSNASIFIMPSHSEGFGFVFLEAMAYGLPIIGGNVDATPEVVIDGETGLLVNPSSVDEITCTASRLLGDMQLRERMAKAGMEHVQSKFSFNNFKQTLYQYLLQ